MLGRTTCFAIAWVTCVSLAHATEVWKDDTNPFVSWNGGVIAFSRDSQIMVFYGRSSRLTSLSLEPIYGPLEKRPSVLGSPLWEEEMGEPAISPDSSMVAWTHLNLVLVTQRALEDSMKAYEFQNVYCTSLRTGRVTRLTSGGGRRPVWSPDGDWVAYITPRNSLRAVNVRTGKVKMLARKMITEGKLTWLASGLAVSVERDGSVAWYHIDDRGGRSRITRPLKLPARLKPSGTFRAWALSRDGSKAVCVDVEAHAGAYGRCVIRLATARSTRTLSRFDGAGIGTVGDVAAPWRVQIAISGNGESFVLSLHGGLWRGSIRGGRLEQITHTQYW